jgi:hypothetical protein
MSSVETTFRNLHVVLVRLPAVTAIFTIFSFGAGLQRSRGFEPAALTDLIGRKLICLDQYLLILIYIIRLGFKKH